MGNGREISRIVRDKGMPVMLKAAVYKTVIRPVLMCGSDTWALRKAEQFFFRKYIGQNVEMDDGNKED